MPSNTEDREASIELICFRRGRHAFMHVRKIKYGQSLKRTPFIIAHVKALVMVERE
jgi:hypothetical protein